MDKYQEQDANGATFNIVPVDDNPPNLWELPDARSNVAVQYATAMAYPTPLFVFRILRNEAAFTQFIHFFLSMQPVPRTVGISFSYFLEHNLPGPDALYMCNLLDQFGARGSSVLVASGDNGVGAPNRCHTFHLGFPASCTCEDYHPFQSLPQARVQATHLPCFAGPWVTSVGGTQNLHPEVAWPRSGGGFSTLFDRPWYQDAEVARFFRDARYPYYMTSFYRYVSCCYLKFSYFLIYAAFMVVATPISLRKHLGVISSSTVLPLSRQAQPARSRCVFLYSLLLPLSVVHYQAPNSL